MVDPKPETDERGDVTVKITPMLTREIFEEYPVVARAYDENVPEPVRRCFSLSLSRSLANVLLPLPFPSPSNYARYRRIQQLSEEAFWTRYFQSKLFNRNRTANRAAVDAVKDDAIFDKYLGEEDDGDSFSLLR